MPTDWKLDTFTVQPNRPIRYPSGELVPEGEQPVPGRTITHWANKRRACSWFTQARLFLEDRATLALCDAPPNFTDLRANQAQVAKQLDFVGRVLNAIAQGYNSLNLVAMNDPMVRAAYHKWISGPPAGDTPGEQLKNWFHPNRNFGGGSGASRTYGRWYFPNQMAPIFGGPVNNNVSGAPAPRGIIPIAARSAYLSFYPDGRTHPNMFVVNVSIDLAFSGSGESRIDTIPEYQPFTMNRAVLRPVRSIADSGFGGSNGQGRMLPDGAALPPISTSDFIPLPGAANGQTAGAWDWRAVFYDTDPILGPVGDSNLMSLVAPMRMYLDYLTEIVNAALARTMDQIILDTRIYVAWMNTQQIQIGYDGQTNGFFNAVSRAQANALQQQSEGDPSLRAAARTIGAVGGALGAALAPTGPGAIAGGVIALVSGVVSGIVGAIGNLQKADVKGIGVDDLGRWKPILQRGYLSGDPNIETNRPSIEENVEPPSGEPRSLYVGGDYGASCDLFLAPGSMQQGIALPYFDWGAAKPKPEDWNEDEESGSIVPWAVAAIILVGGAMLARRQRAKGRTRASGA